MREAGAKPQRLNNPLAKLAPGSEFRAVGLTQVDRLHGYPLGIATDDGLGPVPGDVLIEDVTIRADRVKRVFLTLDVFLDTDLTMFPDISNRELQGPPDHVLRVYSPSPRHR